MSFTRPIHGIPSLTCEDVFIKVAETREEREAAFRLTYSSYVRSGLCEPHSSQIRVTPYQLLPTTDVFIATLRDEVICTVSLARDGELGLPMESLYAHEIHERRETGLRVAEVTCLADRRSGVERFFGLFCDLTRLMVQHAAKQGVDQLLIAVHPRHAAIYRRYMAFNVIGEERSYSDVCGNPAVPLCLDLNEIKINRPKSFDQFFGEQIPDDVLQVHPLSLEDRFYFSDLVNSGSPWDSSSGMHLYTEQEEENYRMDENTCSAILCA